MVLNVEPLGVGRTPHVTPTKPFGSSEVAAACEGLWGTGRIEASFGVTYRLHYGFSMWLVFWILCHEDCRFVAFGPKGPGLRMGLRA